MPPKKAAQNKKQAEKVKQKIIEDKTFGLKNKKGAKAQKYIKSVQQSIQNRTPKPQGPTKSDKIAEKKAKQKEEKELAELFKPVINKQKAPAGVNPKTIVCEFFKKGQCTKGAKCKFSHDLQDQRKSGKIDLYTDPREIGQSPPPSELLSPEKICNYFLEAVMEEKYGYFWVCPNGGDKCPLRHALPPGYVLKPKDAPKEVKEEPPLEEVLEQERAKLAGKNLTPVTPETFKAWKEQKLKEKEEQRLKEEKERQESIKAGKLGMSGRELLVYRPELFVDDDDVLDIAAFKSQMGESIDEEEYQLPEGQGYGSDNDNQEKPDNINQKSIDSLTNKDDNSINNKNNINNNNNSHNNNNNNSHNNNTAGGNENIKADSEANNNETTEKNLAKPEEKIVSHNEGKDEKKENMKNKEETDKVVDDNKVPIDESLFVEEDVPDVD
jgi:hypothetical protein